MVISYCKKLPQNNVVVDNDEEEETKKKERKQYEQELLKNLTPWELSKSVEYVRKFFGIKGDYKPHEEEKYCEEYAWAFEGVDED
ncbi:hypothetical protein SO802_006986 [Lithocarpus litseifolius]|uniref:SKP1 component dimerisation domain-containing protein n=1 Tax=Lithocarpus litseifolius TaxID=425828 RepID=A0AAW2DQL5_9ROSI